MENVCGVSGQKVVVVSPCIFFVSDMPGMHKFLISKEVSGLAYLVLRNSGVRKKPSPDNRFHAKQKHLKGV